MIFRHVNTNVFKRFVAVALSALASGVVSLHSAMPARAQEKPPQAPPLKDKPLPPIVEKQLPNGLRVFVIEDHRQPLISMSLAVRAGSVFDPKGKNGVASMTASLLTQGTKTRKAQDIASAIDRVGGTLNAGAGDDSATVNASVLSDSLPLALELAADVVRNPAFAEEEINRAKQQAAGGFRQQAESPDALGGATFDRMIFGSGPYAFPSSGTLETVSGLKQADFVAFHAAHYTPKGAVLVMVGDFKPTAALALVEKHFGDWSGGEVSLPQAAPSAPGGLRIVVLDKPDSVQTKVIVGCRGVAYNDPEKPVARMLNAVLGSGGFSNRLQREIRVKRGLSYGVNSFLDSKRLAGAFGVDTETKTESTVEVVKLILDEINKLREAPVSDDELGPRRGYLLGRDVLDTETPADIAADLMSAVLYGEGRKDIESYRRKIAAVTAADIQAFAKNRLDPKGFTIVLVGNASAFEKDLASIGKVEKIPYREVDFLAADLRKSQPKSDTATGGDPTLGASLLKKTVEAHGGQAFLDVKTTFQSGSGTFAPPGIPQTLPVTSATLTTADPNKVVMVLKTAFGDIAFGSEGKGRQWVSAPGAGVNETDNPDEGKFGVVVLRKAARGGEYSVAGLPDVELDGRKTHVFTISDKDGNATKFLVDAESGLISKLEYKSRNGQVEILFSDYQAVNGVKTAKKFVQKLAGSTVLDLTFIDTKINEPVEDAVFKKP